MTPRPRRSLCAWLAILAGCGASHSTTGTPAEAVSVSGTVTREQTPYSYNEPITPDPDAHSVIEIRRYEAEDAPAPWVAGSDTPFVGLPFSFGFGGETNDVLADDQTYLVSVVVYNHAGDQAVVGDLVSEYRNEFTGTTRDLAIAVSGLEDCDAPYAGGFCVDTASRDMDG